MNKVTTLNKINVKTKVKEYLAITFAQVMFGIALYTFILPAKFVSGGAAGLAAILEIAFNFPVQYAIVLINLPLLVLALIFLKPDFAIKTIYSIAIVSLTTTVLSAVNFFKFESNILLAVFMSGIICGIDYGLLFNANGSGGGSEIIARMIYKKYPNANLAMMLMAIDSLSMVLSGFFIDWWAVVYAVLMNYIASLTFQMYLNGFDPAIKFNVFTTKPKEIYDAISTTFKRGATQVEVEDCKGREMMMMSVVVQHRQQAKFKKIIKQVDSNCTAYSELVEQVMRPRFNDRYR